MVYKIKHFDRVKAGFEAVERSADPHALRHAMSHDHDEKDAKGELLPCPFCGDDSPRMFYRMDESVYSHAVVQYLRITCDECDCESIDSEDHNEVIAAWNRRADTASIVTEAAAKEREACAHLCRDMEQWAEGLERSDFAHGQRSAALTIGQDIRARATQPDAGPVECGCCATGCPAGQCRHAKENP